MNLVSREQKMNASFDPLHLVNTYGAFGSITRDRYEIVLEGTSDTAPSAATGWKEYEFKGKPGDPARRPPQVAPYHMRLDWLMWFEAMSPQPRSGWFFNLLAGLLNGDANTLSLLRGNPFPDAPPRFIRAQYYKYEFTTPAEHRAKVASYVADTASAFRGKVPEGAGYWYPCTLVEATNDDRVAREEVFGPVAAVIRFADEEEAVRIANDTPYGLSGSVWTENGARAFRVARAIDTGVVSINSNSSVRHSTPFGGFKQSGFGRELGMHALEGYSEVKNVFMAT